MKKLLLTAATAAVLSSSFASNAMAQEMGGAAENMFYVKAVGGFTMLNKNSQTVNFQAPVGKANVKYKKQNTGFAGIAFGYNVMDNVRADLEFNTVFNPTFKASGSNLNGINGLNYSSKIKGQVMTLMLNGYVDVFDISAAKIFIGAGVGMSQNTVKFSADATFNGLSASVSTKTKKKNAFAYQVSVGAAMPVAQGVDAEVFYRWADYGNSNKKLKSGKSLNTAVKFRGHNVGAGIRFSF